MGAIYRCNLISSSQTQELNTKMYAVSKKNYYASAQHFFKMRVARTHNKAFAIAGVPPNQVRDRLCSADTFVKGGNFIPRIKFSAKTSCHRKPINRYRQI